ncbi:hypothetical protein EJ110_NYTH10865 [Nymphaea thermarum]|nr:hypothetical protein EJ110_NYTH10865 [Nymphaea thermarum]
MATQGLGRRRPAPSDSTLDRPNSRIPKEDSLSIYAMRQKDLGWQYCSRISETDRSFVRCNFCQREIHGGISRFKQHIAKLKGECKGCTRVPAAVSREMREYIAGKKLERQQKQESSEKAFDNGNLEIVLKDDGDDIGMEVAKLPGAPGFEEDIATRAERGKASIGDDGASTLVALRTRPAIDEYICSGDDDDGSDDEDGGNKDEPYEVQPAGDMDEGYYQPPYDYELGDMNLPQATLQKLRKGSALATVSSIEATKEKDVDGPAEASDDLGGAKSVNSMKQMEDDSSPF